MVHSINWAIAHKVCLNLNTVFSISHVFTRCQSVV